MALYRVRVELQTIITTEIEADTETEARELAYDQCRINPSFVDVISNDAELIDSEDKD